MQPKKRNHIYQSLKGEIRGNSLRRLPGEYPLARRYHVCRETIREALKLLVDERLIRRSQGSRTMANYIPDQAADTILVILSPFQNPVEELRPLAAEAGLKILEMPCEKVPLNDLDWIDAFTRENHIIGIVLCFSWFYGSESFCELFSRLYLPVYLPYISRELLLKSHCSGGVQETRTGWKMALQYLAEAGHTRVATFAPTSKLQFHGIPLCDYETMLEECSLSSARELWCQKPCFYEGEEQVHDPKVHYVEIRNELKRMMALPHPPTAALCYSNQWAVVLYRACQELKIRIPRDISIMGFLSMEEKLVPALTTVVLESENCFRQMLSLFLSARQKGRVGQLIAQNQFVIYPGKSVRPLTPAEKR